MANFIKTIIVYFKLFWYLFKFFLNLIYGIWKISKLKIAPVSIFGGTHLKEDNIYMQKAKKLGELLALEGIPILTGGGPGIMEAASCGSSQIKKNIIKNIGISVKNINNSKFNECVQDSIVMDNFYSRKWLLINYSIGFAVFPGGFGTLDELSNLLTLIQTNQRPKVPIILVGLDYWNPFISWINDYMLANNLIAKEDFQLFKVTDSVEEAFNLLKVHCKKQKFKIFE